MKTFIAYQIQVVSEEKSGSVNNVNLRTVVRKIKAKSENEAIGKFVTQTQDIKAQNKLDIECFLLSELRTID